MANMLINGHFSRMQLALDRVISSMITEGNDAYKNGIWRMASRFNTNSKLFTLSSSSLTVNNGKLYMISDLDVDCNENSRVNPLCDFSNSVFNSVNLVAWADYRTKADNSDYKHGRRDIYDNEYTEADDFANPLNLTFDAGRAIGTFKNIFASIDCKTDLASGVCCFQEYNLEDAQCYGFHSNIDGLTSDNEIILSNDSAHCQARKNLKTGKLTYIEETDPVYNLVPTYFSQAVVLGDYIYYVGADSYIHKVNKTTLIEELRSSSSSYSYSGFNLFTDGTNLYISYMYTSNGNSRYAVVDTDDLGVGSYQYYHETMPAFMNYSSSYPARNCMLASIDNGTKFVLYSYIAKCAVVFTDLADIKGSIIPELTQFNIGGNSVGLVSFGIKDGGIYSFWLGATYHDLGGCSEYSVKVCKNTNGQLFSIAQWETASENTGAEQKSVTVFE